MQNAPLCSKGSILQYFRPSLKLPFVIKIFVLSIFITWFFFYWLNIIINVIIFILWTDASLGAAQYPFILYWSNKCLENIKTS